MTYVHLRRTLQIFRPFDEQTIITNLIIPIPVLAEGECLHTWLALNYPGWIYLEQIAQCPEEE